MSEQNCAARKALEMARELVYNAGYAVCQVAPRAAGDCADATRLIDEALAELHARLTQEKPEVPR